MPDPTREEISKSHERVPHASGAEKVISWQLSAIGVLLWDIRRLLQRAEEK